ncbi:MAG TPA: DUF5666 domain-containing protein [Acidimicrobiales bacterium]|nr:DUF5666 domain-containing protein [Acidimicrobiales bacterium]
MGRSVSALAIGMTLTVGSASLASASGHHDHGNNGGVASGKMSSFDYANLGLGGYVTAVTPTSVTVLTWGGTTTTFTLNTTTVYTEGKSPSTITSLVVGDRVNIQTSSSDPTIAASVNIELAELFGTVTAVSGNTITITDPQGFSRTILVGTATTYTVGGAPGSLTNVMVGTKIVAQGTIDTNKTTLDALSIKIGSAGTMDNFRGVVTAFTGTSLTVLGKGATTPTVFTLTTTTTFKDDGQTLSAADLAVGSNVGVEVSSAASTTALNVEIELAHLSGKVTAISGDTITVEKHHGTTATIVVGPTTTYTKDGAPASLTDVVVGAKISGEGTLSTDGLTLAATSVNIEHGVVLTPEPQKNGHGGDHDSDGGNQGPGGNNQGFGGGGQGSSEGHNHH